MINAVVFDLDGVLVDTEAAWDAARRKVVEDNGGSWLDDATAALQGMSSPEWSAYLNEQLGGALTPERISRLVVEEVLGRLEDGLPIVSGAQEAIDRVGSEYPLGLASSANREVIDAVLHEAGWAGRFRVTVSSEEVPRGKPSPDVYLEAARRLDASPESCVCIEDSANGVRSALAAGFAVVAVVAGPFAASPELLARVGAAVRGLDELSLELLADVDRRTSAHREERIDEAEVESFPASDPHSDWAGKAN